MSRLMLRVPGVEHRILGRIDRALAGGSPDAEAFLAEWCRVAPRAFALRLRHAFVAHDGGRYAAAVQRWDDLRADWPDVPMAWCGSAANRRELRRLDEAAAIIAEARRRFPGDLVTVTEAVRIYEASGEIDEALRQSLALTRLDPADERWRLGHFDRLVVHGRLDDAASFLDAQRMDEHPETWGVRVVLLLMRRDGPTAAAPALRRLIDDEKGRERVVPTLRHAAFDRVLRHPAEGRFLFAHLVDIDPDDPRCRHGLIESLIRCGRYDEAAARLSEALERFPTYDDLLRDRGMLALRRERFEDAIADLHPLRARLPDDVEVAALLAHARHGLEQRRAEHLQARPHDEGARPVRQDVGSVEDEGVRSLLLRFQSLGQDCEFGLVQRRYGAEPLGLFRWNFCETQSLRHAVDDGLATIGDPDHHALRLWDDHEYYLQDLRYGFTLHSWVNKHEGEPEALFRTKCRRAAFLRRKLLEDLASGETIFVHKTFATDVDAVRALLRSLRAHGPARLLWVRSAQHDTGAGDPPCLEEIEPGLLAGTISSFGNRGDRPWDIVFPEWIALCHQAIRHFAPPV